MITNEIRSPAVAGMFYEGEPLRLKKIISEFLEVVHPGEVKGEILGLVSPHAGYFYSGKTAAFGYKLIEGRSYRTVILVAPSHYEYFRGVSIYNGSAYRTPLGIIEVDQELRDLLKDYSSIIDVSNRGHGREHALEVQLPFLQVVLGNFKILPLVMGDQSRNYALGLAEILAEVLKGKNVLLVASSDLSHYYTRVVANQLDSIIEDFVNKYDYESLLNHLEAETVEACGGGPMVAVMKAAQLLGANKSKVLYRTDSGEASGETHQVVGYLSAVFYKSE